MLLADLPTPRAQRVLLRGCEEYGELAHRIVSIGAFEHFGHFGFDRYPSMGEARSGSPSPDSGR